MPMICDVTLENPSYESLNYILFPELFYLDLPWYLYQKFLMFKGYKKKNNNNNNNIRMMLLIFFILQFTLCDMWWVSQITSHMSFLAYVYFAQVRVFNFPCLN